MANHYSEALLAKSIEIEQLKTALRAQSDKMIHLNRTRTNYLEKFESLIETYNMGSRNIEEWFRELMASPLFSPYGRLGPGGGRFLACLT